jgi:hypothetical protein
MLKELLANVLNSVLGDYIEDFDKQKMTYAIWGGRDFTSSRVFVEDD